MAQPARETELSPSRTCEASVPTGALPDASGGHMLMS